MISAFLVHFGPLVGIIVITSTVFALCRRR